MSRLCRLKLAKMKLTLTRYIIRDVGAAAASDLVKVTGERERNLEFQILLRVIS